jgi:two-component system, NarL family, invasion response regulator UvrY
MQTRGPLPAKIKILMVDDHAVVREGLKYILSQAPELEVAAEARCVPEALELLRTQHFDVILLDLSLPGQSGIELLRMVKANTPSPLVLVVSASGEDQSAVAVHVFKAGADGYIIKQNVPEALIPAIWQVLGGKKYFSFTPS